MSSAVPDAAELLRRARVLRPVIAAAAAEGERERRVSPAVFGDLQDAGLFRALQPKRWGGYELPPTALYDAEMAVAEGDMSTAWVVGVLGIIPWAIALFDDRAAADVWGEDDGTLVCCALRRQGTAVPVEGGFRLTGRWKYGSGSMHAGWALLGGDCGPSPDGDRLLLVPKDDFEIVDTWTVSGLRATGSHDIVVKDAFVPQHRTHRMVELFDCKGPGQAVNPSALYRLPFGLVFAGGVANAAVGALQGMLNRLVGEINAKRGPTRPNPDLSLMVAEAATTADEARVLVEKNFARLAAYAERSEVRRSSYGCRSNISYRSIPNAAASLRTSCWMWLVRRGFMRITPMAASSPTSRRRVSTSPIACRCMRATGAKSCSASRAVTTSCFS